jgi:hypothetical protein
MPYVAVAFDCQAASHALDKQVNAATGDFELRQHAVPPDSDLKVHIHFEPAIERGWLAPLETIRGGGELL